MTILEWQHFPPSACPSSVMMHWHSCWSRWKIESIPSDIWRNDNQNYIRAEIFSLVKNLLRRIDLKTLTLEQLGTPQNWFVKGTVNASMYCFNVAVVYKEVALWKEGCHFTMNNLVWSLTCEMTENYKRYISWSRNGNSLMGEKRPFSFCCYHLYSKKRDQNHYNFMLKLSWRGTVVHFLATIPHFYNHMRNNTMEKKLKLDYGT